MFDIILKRNKNHTIKKDIKNYNKRKAFNFNKKFILNFSIAMLLYFVSCFIELFVLDGFLLVFLSPFIVVIGGTSLLINEIKSSIRDNIAKRNLIDLVKTLRKNNIKTTLKSITKESEIFSDIPLTKEDETNELLSNNCYVFLDNRCSLQCIVENTEETENKYSILDKNELDVIIKNPKVKKLIKNKR